jgi:hypothetical protein
MDAEKPPDASVPTTATDRRPRKIKLFIAVACVVVIAGVGGAVFASFHRPNPYQSFRRSCLATAGNTVVTLSTTAHSEYMGGPSDVYSMGCREANGTISAKATTNHP